MEVLSPAPAGRPAPHGPGWVLAVLDAGDDGPPSLRVPASPGGASLAVEVRAVTDAAALDELLARLSPPLLLIDTRCLEGMSTDAIERLRHRHLQTRWVVAWRPGAPPPAELLIRCRAVGGIDWQIDRPDFERAMASALRGELWFPRALLQQLYLSLLEGRTGHEASTIDVASGLSLRQSQALALVREGMTNKQIAKRLGVSVNTVKKHLAEAFMRAGLHRRRQLYE